MASLIFYTDIIINRKNWRIAINKTFEHRSIFLTKRTYAHTRTPPSSYSFLFVFQWPPSLPPPPQRTYFLNDPLLRRKSLNIWTILTAMFCTFLDRWLEPEGSYKFMLVPPFFHQCVRPSETGLAWNHYPLVLFEVWHSDTCIRKNC